VGGIVSAVGSPEGTLEGCKEIWGLGSADGKVAPVEGLCDVGRGVGDKDGFSLGLKVARSPTIVKGAPDSPASTGEGTFVGSVLGGKVSAVGSPEGTLEGFKEI
jgi:hypothetical protein